MATQNAINLLAGANITLTPSSSGLTIAAAGGASTAAPLFNAYVSAPQAGVTGDGTAYTVLFDTALSNVGATYVAATGIFTAPVAGQYIFSGSVLATNNNLGGTITGVVSLVTTGVTYIANNGASGVGMGVGSPINEFSWPFSIITTMAMGDTAHVSIAISGGGAGSCDVNSLGSYWGAYQIG